MAMSKRSGGEKQEDIWIAHTELAVAPGHPFYKRLNELLEGAGFDELVERLCARFYHARLGRPSLRPGIYFRALLIGYFEGIESERGIAWRLADSLALRRFLGIGLDEQTRRSLDDLADPAVDRHATGIARCSRGCWECWPNGTAEGTADGHRRDHLGSECGDAVDCAARYWGELRRVLAGIGKGVRDRHADPRGPGAVGPEAQEANLEQGLEESARRGRAHQRR